MEESIVVKFTYRYLLFQIIVHIVLFFIGPLQLPGYIINLFFENTVTFTGILIFDAIKVIIYSAYPIICVLVLLFSISTLKQVFRCLKTSNPILVINESGFHSKFEDTSVFVTWDTIQSIRSILQERHTDPKKYKHYGLCYLVIVEKNSDIPIFLPYGYFDYLYGIGGGIATSYTEKQMYKTLKRTFSDKLNEQNIIIHKN